MALDWADTGGSQWFITTVTAAAPRREVHRLRASRERLGRARSRQCVGCDRTRADLGRGRVAVGAPGSTDFSGKKKGATVAPFPLAGGGAYRFLPPFFFAPLAAFLAIVMSPLSRWDVAEAQLTVSWPFDCRPTLKRLASWRIGRSQRIRRPRNTKGAHHCRTLCRPHPLKSSPSHLRVRLDCPRGPSLVVKAPSLVRTVPNKWAERVALTQDVDYGRLRLCQAQTRDFVKTSNSLP